MTDFPDDAPSSPLAALLGDLASQAQSGAMRVLLAALDHVLNQQAWARERLSRHAGSTIRIAVEARRPAAIPAPELLATVGADGFLDAAEPGAVPAANLVFVPSADAMLAVLGDGPDTLAKHVRIDGEAALVATLGELAKYLRWDAEEDLSRVVGDITAHRVAGFLRGSQQGLADLARRGRSAAAQFAADGRSPVAGRAQLQQFLAAVEALESRVRGLETRAAHLRG